MSQLTDPEGPEGLVVFRYEERGYRCLDVLQAADFRGELEPHREALFEGVDRATRAADLDLEIPDESLDALTESFRYERNLISAEETERWLEERRLTLEDYEDFFVRQHWKSAPDDELDGAEPAGEPLDPEETRRLLAIDLLMSGEVHVLARRLAWRVAALHSGDGDGPSAAEVEEERSRFFERSGTGPATLAEWFDRVGCDAGWFEELLRMEAAFRRRCASLLTRQARERALRTQRLDLVRFDLEVLELDSEAAAREAYLCAVADGMSFRELAEETRYPYTRARVLAGQLDDGERQRLISAKPGEVLPPTNGSDRHQLCRVLEKIDPAVDDADIRARIDDLLVGQHFAALAGRQVQWLIDGDAAG